ncbi:hypothetical protein [Pseudomonas chlororaphis]|uniref:hypothetical protein n=1 Tax=Pseudomonas chlororaphis TaxID=587753 RepID=UPI0011DDD75F|nr:hypothetical protein [Pseudomonas chlororaphis]
MNKYRIHLDDELICETEWSPLAQAAWNRAARNRDSAQSGGTAEIWKGSELLSRVRPQTLHGHPWPDKNSPECDLRDVIKHLLLLLRHDGWDAKEVAEAMTAAGLPTTRSRIDALRGSTPGKRTELVPAELVVLISSILGEYKRTE